LAAGAAATFTLVVRATGDPGFPYLDLATIATTTFDPDSTNDTVAGAVFLSIPRADLAVAITAAPDPLRPGQDLTYTIFVFNNGPYAAPAATLAVTPPAGVTFGSATTSRFLAQVYPDLLGRPIDTPALLGYSQALAAGKASRTQVAESILASAEYRSNLV